MQSSTVENEPSCLNSWYSSTYSWYIKGALASCLQLPSHLTFLKNLGGHNHWWGSELTNLWGRGGGRWTREAFPTPTKPEQCFGRLSGWSCFRRDFGNAPLVHLPSPTPQENNLLRCSDVWTWNIEVLSWNQEEKHWNWRTHPSDVT